MDLPGARWRGNWPPGWDVRRVAETGSTNADLLTAGQAGAPGRTVLAADHQTAGRGRLDRRWEAPPGANLLVSLLFRERLDAPHALTQLVGVAAARAARRVAGVDARLKWPNDVLVGDEKLAGILAQAGGGPDGVAYVVVGLGMNVGWAPPGAARLAAGTPAAMLHALLEALTELLEPANRESAFLEYRQLLATLGRAVRIEQSAGSFDATAVDVEPDGALVVDVAGERRRIDVGDVVHLRLADR